MEKVKNHESYARDSATTYPQFFIVLTACNTVAGIGQDITASADWAKQKISGSSKAKETRNDSATQKDTSLPGKASVDNGGSMK